MAVVEINLNFPSLSPLALCELDTFEVKHHKVGLFHLLVSHSCG